MEESILESIKKMLGVLVEDTAFDPELISHINAAISDITQIAVGPDEGFIITGYNETWSQLVSNVSQMSSAREYVFTKVRLNWDPPSNSFMCDALSKTKDESYWRLYMMADPK